jgi:glycosyltransferase involved in cell wall biosynthesis
MPYPLSEGGRISQFAVIDYLRKKHHLTLVLVSSSFEDDESIHQLEIYWPDIIIKKIVLYSKQPVTEGKLQGSVLSGVKRTVRKVLSIFLSEPQVKKQSHPDPLNTIFVNLTLLKDGVFIEKLGEIISRNDFDIIQVDLIEYADLAYLLPKNVKKVFVHHEIRYARILTSFQKRDQGLSTYQDYVIKYVKAKEKMLLNLYDAIFVFSEDDKMKLESEMPGKRVMVAPFPVLDSHFTKITNEHAVVNKLVFVGPEIHQPNKDAVEWYMEEIALHVNKISNLKLHVVGKWSPETISKYASNQHIVFEGFVDDLVDFCTNSIMIVPVRIGSGIRTKILYAMAQGIPVVSATVGCEGIGAVNNENILIADTPEAFANSINRIQMDKDLALHIINNAQQMVKQKYSQEAVSELRNKYFEELIHQ